MAHPAMISGPAFEPLSLADARLHLRIDDDNLADDALISALIVVARQQAEHELCRRLITQTWDTFYDAFPADGQSMRIASGLSPVQSIVEVAYLDTAGQAQTMSAADYTLDPYSLPGYVFPLEGVAWPADVSTSANAVRVRVTCGYGATAADVPAAIRQWMLLQVGAMYAQRETYSIGVAVNELPNRFVDRLLDPYRVHGA